MFDIGFAEIIVIAIVGLLVIGPERLPSAIRTGALWLNRLRRGFNEIKMEVQQELHNDSVMQELRKTGEQLKEDTQTISGDLHKTIAPLTQAGDEPVSQQEPDSHAGTTAENGENLSTGTHKE
jgi:sec-independent protein translocase protein TatB